MAYFGALALTLVLGLDQIGPPSAPPVLGHRVWRALHPHQILESETTFGLSNVRWGVGAKTAETILIRGLKAYHQPFLRASVQRCSGNAGAAVRRPRSRLSVICTACSQLSRVTVSCALTVSESLIKIDDVALEHCCSLGGPGARRSWRERRSEVVMYDIV